MERSGGLVKVSSWDFFAAWRGGVASAEDEVGQPVRVESPARTTKRRGSGKAHLQMVKLSSQEFKLIQFTSTISYTLIKVRKVTQHQI